jgi:hypothetical protein
MRTPLALCLLVAPAAAAAHVAPSPDANNRYLRATLLPGEVRTGFTIFFGDRPGAEERRRMDANGDGRIDAAEAAAFGLRVRDRLAPGLAVTVDGRTATGWSVADVGLGIDAVAAGALSVDLALVVPYDDPRAAEHSLHLADDLEVDRPGEGEIRVEESPGVRTIGNADLALPFIGNPSARGERAIDVRFAVDPALRPPPAHRVVWLAGPALLVVAAAVALAAWARRRRAPT